MAWEADIAELSTVRDKLATLLPNLDRSDVHRSVAAYLLSQVPLPRAAIAVAVERSVEWVGREILRVGLRMRRDAAFREAVEGLEASLLAAIGA